MRELGAWMRANGEAIYGTRPLYPYCRDKVRFTQSKDGKHRYALCLLDEGTRQVSFAVPFAVKKVRLISSPKGGQGGNTVIKISATEPMQHAVAVEVIGN